MNAGAYTDLTVVAERVKLRDLAAYAKLHRRNAALSAKIAALTATLERESATSQPGDVSSALALQQFASIAARQVDRLLVEQRALSQDLEAARQAALRANGRIQALEMLIASERQAEKLQRQRSEERNAVL